jgi:hypothetical protein
MIAEILPDWITRGLPWMTGWLPTYTEPWATTYLQLLFQSFLFALGVPTAIYSLIVDEDIKRVGQTRVKAKRFFWVTATLYVAVFILVWFIHPEKSADVPPTGSSMAKSFFAAFTVTFLPAGVLIMGIRLNREFKREKVVRRLADALLENLNAKQSIDTVALRDLSFLGEHGRPGDEKDIVLNVIDQLTVNVQKKVKEGMTYKGYELESLIRHLPTMLDNTNRPGNDQNFLRAVEVLANIWRWLTLRKVSSDALSTREALKLLALRSVESMVEDTSLAYLELAAECDSHMVFDMRQAAIRTGKYRLASAALSKLEAMANNAIGDEGVKREICANLLGIAADFAANGPSGIRRAETALRLNGELFKPSLRQALADAIDYQYNAGRFEIADKISLFLLEVAKMKSVRLDGQPRGSYSIGPEVLAWGWT